MATWRRRCRPTEGRRPFRIAPHAGARRRRCPSVAEPRRHLRSSTSRSRSSSLVTTVVVLPADPRRVTSGRDDWPLALRGQTPGDFLQPVQRAPQRVIILVLYRTLYKVFGFDTLRAVAHRGPHCRHRGSRRAVSRPAHQDRPVHRRLSSRPTSSGSRTRPSLPSSLEPLPRRSSARSCARAALEHDATAPAISSSAARSRSRSAPRVAACRSSAACLVYALCTRARLRRWLAILVPSATVARVVAEVRP